PVYDPGNGAILGVLGLDVEANKWQQLISRARVWPIAITALVTVIMLVFGAYMRRQQRWILETQRRIRLQDTLLYLVKADMFLFDRALEEITRVVAMTVEVERVGVWRFDRQTGEAVCEKVYTKSTRRYDSGERMPVSACPRYFQAMQGERVIDAGDARSDPRTREFADTYLKPHGIFSLLDVSVWSHGKVTGIVCLEHAGYYRKWRPEEVSFAVSIAEMLSSLIESQERRRAEEELQNAYEKLKLTQSQLIQSSKMAAIGQLASGVAHEINNPLTGVLNNVQLIMMQLHGNQPPKADEFAEIMKAVEDSALRCKKITKALLDFARASGGSFENIRLNDIMEQAVTIIGQELKLKNITLNKDLMPGLPVVRGDPQLLQQVIFDLVVNAKWAVEKKGGGDGGFITLGTGYDSSAQSVNITISDNGVGIPQENLQKIYDPFFTTKAVGEGTGLGLSICYNIIKEHNGRIAVSSKAGEGTTFTISLPALTLL
ncbi:MAG: ATP-binding protein, partial [Candidatus Omnitrophica bacterium]|nr:ATP-binding protein [Candidatus Omnitrophota bacterium]